MTEYTPIEDLEGDSVRSMAEAVTPPWLSAEVGARYTYSQAINYDGLADWFRYGMLQRHPEYAQPGALQYLGRDKGIFRGLSEGDASYSERLARSKTTWKLAGNAPTLVKELYDTLSPSGYSKIRYVTNGAWSGGDVAEYWTADSAGVSYYRADPNNWDWDGTVEGIRFWLIFYSEGFVSPPAWGSAGSWGGGGFWGAGSGFDRAPILDAYNLIRKFKAAGSHAGEYTAKPRYDGGIIIADPTETGPWGGSEPFDPTLPPGSPMPDGAWDVPSNRVSTGIAYLTGL